VGLPFSPARITLFNGLADPTAWALYGVVNGDIRAGANTFGILDSTGAVNACLAATCFKPSFAQGYSYAGGSSTAYVPATQTVYFPKSSDRRYLGTYVNGAAGADVDLGAGMTANAVVYDPASDRVYVAMSGGSALAIVNPATNAVSTLAGVGFSPGLLALDKDKGKLYVYSPSDGSVAEVILSPLTLSTVKTGLPTSAALGSDPGNLAVVHAADELVTIALPASKKIFTYDIANARVSSATISDGADELNYDPVNQRLYGVSRSTKRVYRLK
jgi:DNA-binding beta-propeller fold protein YncE